MNKIITTLIIVLIASTLIKAQTVPNYVPTESLKGWWGFNNTGNDAISTSIPISNTAASTTDRFGIANSAYYFNGSNIIKYTNTSHPLFNIGNNYQTFTISFWVNPTNNAGAFILGTFGWGYFVGLTPNNNIKFSYVYSNSPPHWTTLTSSASVTTNIWQMISITRSGTTNSIYINGVLNNTLTSEPNFLVNNNNNNCWFGANGQDNNSYLSGKLDDIGIWNRALTDQEIKKLYESKDEDKIKQDSKKTSESTKPANQDIPSLPILKVSEKNASNQLPKTILVFDKAQSLTIGNTVSITKVEKIKVPGEKKPQTVPSILGSGRVIEKLNNIYTVKLNANTAQKLKDYKDGDESYFCMKAEDKLVVASKPRIMVIPKLIKQDLFKDGNYQLNSFEKMIIASFKNKLEDNDYTTIGFESILKKVYEDRLINEGTKLDLKALILEASGSDFYVEFEPLESSDCNKTLDFKIRNYANGEDVASDIKIMNTCGTPDDYKNFASAILNEGALNKINTQYASLVSQGRKVSANFTIKNGSTAEFGKEYNGIRLEEYIENCIQQYAFNGNYKPAGTVNNRMSFSEVSIPLLKEETGQNYSPNAFSLDILKYLKEQAGIECEKSVVGSNINITIK